VSIFGGRRPPAVAPAVDAEKWSANERRLRRALLGRVKRRILLADAES